MGFNILTVLAISTKLTGLTVFADLTESINLTEITKFG